MHRRPSAHTTRQELKLSTRQHAKARAEERYGLRLNRESYEILIERIHHEQYLAARRLTCSRTAILLEYRGQYLLLIYSHTLDEIVTFPPPEDYKWAELEALSIRGTL